MTGKIERVEVVTSVQRRRTLIKAKIAAATVRVMGVAGF
jgi:hypothetical protein